jgi:Mg-chelatase subunit ChlD
MKSKLVAATLFSLTAAVVVTYPAYQSLGAPFQIDSKPVIDMLASNHIVNEKPRIEVVFVLDTTGSMSGLIDAAKEKIWSVASTMASAQSSPEIKMGLVAYRDRGDAYVTQTIDLTNDLDSMYATLMDFEAAGGGDGPESVNQALHEAVHNISWSQDDNTYRVVFLVGDAPAHMDYQDDVKYPVTIAAASLKGIVVNAIQCGTDTSARDTWQQIAQLGSGDYFQVDQSGSAIAIATPFDEELAKLSAELNDTRMTFGDAEEQRKAEVKAKAIDKLEKFASFESKARRAAFNATESGERNLLGNNELVHAVVTGEVDLTSIEKENLPVALQPLTPSARKKVIEDVALVRNELQLKIHELSQDRSSFIQEKVDEAGGARQSLDDKIYRAVKSQAATVGLVYESEAAEY